MAVVLIEGYENIVEAGGNSAGSSFLRTGWINSTFGPAMQSLADPRPRADGSPAGVGCLRFGAGNVYITFREFPLNGDTGAPLRLREVHVGFGCRLGSGTGTNANTPFGQVGVGPTPGVRAAGLCLQSDRMILFRNTVGMASTLEATTPFEWYGYWLSVFLDSVAGWAKGYREASYPVPTLAFTGNTSNGNDFATTLFVGAVSSNAQNAYDDVLVIAPSLRINTPAASATANELVTGTTSGATARVSDFEPTRQRLWLHSWDETPWQDGETLTGSISGVLGTVSVPDATYLHGFEPWSFPRPASSGGLPYIVATSPQASTLNQLAPIGGAVNVENINSFPVDGATRNQATVGNKGDTYGSCTALPAWVLNVHAVQVEAAVQASSTGGYLTHEVVLTDGAGAQSIWQPTSEQEWTQAFTLPTKSDGTPWSLSDIASMTLGVEFTEV